MTKKDFSKKSGKPHGPKNKADVLNRTTAIDTLNKEDESSPEILEDLEVTGVKATKFSPTPPPPPGVAASSEGGPEGGAAKTDFSQKHTLEINVKETLDQAAKAKNQKPQSYFSDEKGKEVSDEPTHIMDAEEIENIPYIRSAKLSVIDGPERGKEFLIHYNEIFGGRGIENDFVISDLAISRKHFRIHRNVDDYVLTDLESGNGLYVNGERVQQTVLQEDDMIVAGKTVMRFTRQAKEKSDDGSAVGESEKTEDHPQGLPPAPATSVETGPPPVQKTVEEGQEKAPEKVEAPKPEEKPKQPKKEAEQPKRQEPKKGAQQTREKEAPKKEAEQAREKEEPKKSQELKAEPAQAPAAKQPAGSPKDTQVTSAAKPPQTSSGLIIGLVIAFLAVLLIVVAVLMMQKDSEVPKSTKPVREKVTTVDSVSNFIKEAKGHLKNELFDQAVTKCEEALKVKPNDTDALQLKSWIAKEQQFKKEVGIAQQLLADGKIDEAEAALKEIPEQSQYYGQAGELLAKLPTMRLQARVAEASQLVNQEKYKEALPILEGVLKESPGHTEAQRLKVICEAKLSGATVITMTPEEKKPEPKKRVRVTEPEPDEDKPEPPPVAKAPAEEVPKGRKVNGRSDLDSALRNFKRKNLDQAKSELKEIAGGYGDQTTIKKAKDLVSKINLFEVNYDKGRYAAGDDKPVEAIPSLKKAWSLERQIAPGSEYQADILRLLGDMYYQLGDAFIDDNKFDKAYKSFRRALKAKPGHIRAQKGMEKLEAEARKLYYEAKALVDEDRESARRKFMTVKKIVSSSNKYYKKAQEELDKM